MIPFKKFIPGIAWFFLVLILICLPGDDLPKGEDWMSAIYFDKWVHTGLFGIQAFLIMLPFIQSSTDPKKIVSLLLKIAAAISIWGLTTEFIQEYFIPGRAFEWGDWAADSLGALLAFFLSRFLGLRMRHTKT